MTGYCLSKTFTPTAAQDVVAHFINDRRLKVDRDALPEPGRLVFIYRKTTSAPLLSDHAAFPRRAA